MKKAYKYKLKLLTYNTRNSYQESGIVYLDYKLTSENYNKILNNLLENYDRGYYSFKVDRYKKADKSDAETFYFYNRKIVLK